MLEHDALVITGSTLGNPPWRELVEAAAGGGFRGLSLWPDNTYGEARRAGVDVAEMRQVLADNDVSVNDVDVLACWVGAGDSPFPPPDEALIFEAGEALGARLLNVVMMGDGPPDIDRMAERFAALFDRAAAHGLTAHLEFVPFMAVPDVKTAWAVVEAAGRDAAGIMVDSWHCFRGPTTDAALRAVPGERILGVQLNDAPAEAMSNAIEETLHHRLLPGEGAIGVPRLIALLDEIGCRAPLTAEVFSDALLASGDAAAIARRVGDAMRAVRAQAK